MSGFGEGKKKDGRVFFKSEFLQGVLPGEEKDVEGTHWGWWGDRFLNVSQPRS